MSEQRQQLLIEQETLKGTMKGLETTMAHLTEQLSTARTSAETLTTDLETLSAQLLGVNRIIASKVDRTGGRPKGPSDRFRRTRSFTGCPSITRTRTSSTACTTVETTTQELAVATEKSRVTGRCATGRPCGTIASAKSGL